MYLCRMITEIDLEEDWEDPETEPEETPAPVERMRIIADRGQELLRIDKFLMNRIEGATRNKIQQSLESGFIKVNGQAVKPNYKVRAGDEIVIFDTRRPEYTEIIAEQLPLDIVYEDEDVLIINKQAGMVVHPGCGNYTGTLVNGLAWYLRGDEEGALPRVGLVHRIDKDTSGLVVVAKTEQAMADLNAQFKKHTVHRRYTALVWGDFEDEGGTVIAHVGRHRRFRKIMDAYPDGEHGKEAITHYKVLERFNYVTLLELKLETGRTHQIRVHMKSIGHPLFNDVTYGGGHIVKGTVFTRYKQFVENCFKVLPRQALHARELGFIHPRTRAWIQFTSDLPEDIQEVVGKWRSYTQGMTQQLRDKLDQG